MVVMVLTHGKPILVIDGIMFLYRGHYFFKNLSSREGGRAKWDLDAGVLDPFFKNVPGVRGTEYILLTFASEDNADKDMNVISVKSSEGILFMLNSLFSSPTWTLSVWPEVFSEEYQLKVPAQKGLRKT